MWVSPQVAKSMCLLRDESLQRRQRRNKNESIEDNALRVLFSDWVWLGSRTNPAGNFDSDTSVIDNAVDVEAAKKEALKGSWAWSLFWRFLIAGWTLCNPYFLTYIFPKLYLAKRNNTFNLTDLDKIKVLVLSGFLANKLQMHLNYSRYNTSVSLVFLYDPAGKGSAQAEVLIGFYVW